ncbi:hypothetical protein G4G27_14360 [Sphingomonas sp. So64.6b]|uniref:hypothetical protein n=1 Tax=Sphingomonas sp. So64.6b TaxID=2997354 RepID=UPI001602A81F|nr:hypothetical protein [Sphingomonas sp. So64.6b]QNA85046.1 hypothetical protein G4G27_14360 [Sphingomonas sp. So64.6b]
MNYRITLAIFVAIFSTGCSATDKAPQSHQAEFDVIYSDFGVDPITGYHEEEIERVGCRYKISADDFASLIIGRASDKEYSNTDIKAEIISDNQERMYVDDSGVLKRSSGYFKINIEKFEKVLVLTKPCDIEKPSPPRP